MKLVENFNIITGALTSLVSIAVLLVSGKKDDKSALERVAKNIRTVFIVLIATMVLTSFIVIIRILSLFLFLNNRQLISDWGVIQNIIKDSSNLVIHFPLLLLFTTAFTIIFRISEEENQSDLTIFHIVKRYVLFQFDFKNHEVYWENVSIALKKAMILALAVYSIILLSLFFLYLQTNQQVEKYPNSANEKIFLKGSSGSDAIVYIKEGTSFKVRSNQEQKSEKSSSTLAVKDGKYYIKSGTKIELPKGTTVFAGNSFVTWVNNDDSSYYEAEAVPGQTQLTLPKKAEFNIYHSDDTAIGKEKYKIIVYRSLEINKWGSALILVYILLLMMLIIYLFIRAKLEKDVGLFILLIIFPLPIIIFFEDDMIRTVLSVVYEVIWIAYINRKDRINGRYYRYFGKRRSEIILDISNRRTVSFYRDGFGKYGKLDIKNEQFVIDDMTIPYKFSKQGKMTFDFENTAYTLFLRTSKAEREERRRQTLIGKFYRFDGQNPTLLIKNSRFGQRFLYNGEYFPFVYDDINKKIRVKDISGNPIVCYDVVKYSNSGKLHLRSSNDNRNLFLFKKGSLAYKKQEQSPYLKGRYHFMKGSKISTVVLKISSLNSGWLLQDDMRLPITMIDYRHRKITTASGADYQFEYSVDGKLILKNQQETLVLYRRNKFKIF